MTTTLGLSSLSGPAGNTWVADGKGVLTAARRAAGAGGGATGLWALTRVVVTVRAAAGRLVLDAGLEGLNPLLQFAPFDHASEDVQDVGAFAGVDPIYGAGPGLAEEAGNLAPTAARVAQAPDSVWARRRWICG